MADKSINSGTKKRCSLHVGKGNASHNDRTFMLDNPNPDNINQASGIRLWTWDKTDFAKIRHKDADYANISSISSAEQAYYDANYKQALDARNSRYQRLRHPDRVKSMLDWHTKLKAPDETILQVGNMHNFAPTFANNTLFTDCVRDYLDWVRQWSAAHGDHVHVLSAAIHYDESSPHAHIRTVYDHQGKDGLEPNIDKALAASGLQPPNPDKPIGRYNNRKMTWTAMQRDAWVSICRQRGLDIEDTPQRTNDGKPLRSLSLTDYARKEDARRMEQAQDLDDREQIIEQREQQIIRQADQLDVRKKQLDVRELQLAKREQQAEQLCANAISREQQAEQLCTNAISIIESAKLSGKSEAQAYFINTLKSIKTVDGCDAYIAYCEQLELQKRELQPPKPPVKQKHLSGAAASLLADADYMQQRDGGVNDYSL